MNNIGKIQPAPIVEEMQRSYLDYAMSVIVSRALPDVKDGLKPVQRRIIYAMHQQNLHHTSRYQKSAAVVGEVLKNYHPHGDAPVYEAMVRMAQNFSLRYMLIDGQGNFGCFTKDTKIRLTDGRSLSFEELIKEQNKGRRHWTFAFNHQDKKIEIAEIQKPRLTRKNAELMEVTLDNGEKIRCTPDHKFMLRDGTYREAQDLQPGTSLMPLYTKLYDGQDKNMIGYEMILQPQEDTWNFTHVLADEWNLKHLEYKKSRGKIRHHKDINKLNNNPDNITRLQWAEHWRLHAEMASWRHKNDPVYVKKIAEGRRKFIENNPEAISLRAVNRNKKMWQNPEYRKQQIKRIKTMWENEEYKEFMRQASSSNLKKLWQTEEFKKLLSNLKSKEMKERWQDKIYRAQMQKHMQAISLKLWSNPKHREYMSQLMKEITQNPQWRKRQSETTKSLWKNPEYRSKFSKDHFSKMAKTLWSDEKFHKMHQDKLKKQRQDPLFVQKQIEAVRAANKRRLKQDPYFMNKLAQKAKIALHKKWQDPLYKNQVIKSKILRYTSSLIKDYPDLTPQIYEDKRRNNGVPNADNALKYFTSFNEIIKQAQTYNHKVVSVRLLKEKEDVYDLTIGLHHNFAIGPGIFVHNSIDGDSPAAMRYTEARLSAISEELLRDINKNTVTFIDNYSGTTQEPVLLPSVIPNLLLNGASGIAVGMATQIPPHNLGEVCDALIYMINHPLKGEGSYESDATVEDLIQIIKGPDFPTGASIYDQTEILAAYATGKGRIVMRAKAEIDETAQGKMQIIVSELPYQVNKATLIARIAELVKDKKLEGVADLRDESDRKQMVRIVFDLKRDSKPQSLLNNLYKSTAMQSVFNVNLVALVDGVPHLLTLKQILTEFIRHRQVIVRKRSEFELAEAKAREHILEGLKIAVDNIDAVIETIKKSKDADEAKANLMKKFKFTEIQAVAILDMQLRRLAALERQKIEDELKMVREAIAYLEDLLAHPEKILKVIKDELTKIKERYEDDRKTRVYKQKIGEFNEEDLVPNEVTIVTITEGGYIKRQSPMSFRTQQRGGKGVMGIATKETDAVSHIFYTQTHDNILFFTDKGRVFQIKVWEIPETQRAAKGQAIVNLINVEQGEKVTAVLTSRAQKEIAKYFLMCTKKGTVKKTALAEYANIRKNGLLAIKLDAGDQLGWVCPTSGLDDVMIVSHKGKSIRFKEKDVRETHRDTSGVRGIKLSKDDEVVSCNILGKEEGELLVVMENGLGKKTLTSSWSRQGRGGQGVKAAQVTAKTGNIVTAQVVDKKMDTLVLTSTKGQLIKMSLKEVPTLQRQTQGVILMRTRPGEKVAAATVVSSKDKAE